MNRILVFILIALSISFVSSQQTRAQLRARFNEADFIFDLANSQVVATGDGGTVRPLGVSEMPSLEGEGVSHSLFNLAPCGMNMFHSHPRATEILYVIDAESLQVGFVEENGGRVLVNQISSGFTTFFPRGLIHFQQNLSCKNATYLSALNSEDPGVVTISLLTFMFPDQAISTAFNIDENQVNTLRGGLPKNPAPAFNQGECFKRCNLQPTSTSN